MLRTLLMLVALLLASFTVVAGVLPETPQFRRFGFEQGLPKVANHIALDRQGYVWIATSDGLARYDGVDFRMWRRAIGQADSLPDNLVEIVFVDPLNRVWVASADSLSVLGVDRRAFRTLRFPSPVAGCGKNVTAMAAASNRGMWLATAGGDVCHLDSAERVKRYAAPAGEDRSIMAMVVDERGRVLLGTHDGLLRLEDGRFKRVGNNVLAKSWVTILSTEPDGTLWIGSEKGLHRLHVDDRLLPAPWKLPVNATHPQVLRDRRGRRWIGTMNGLYSEKDGLFSLVENAVATAAMGPETGILYMQEDLEGGIWFVTFSQGVMYLPPDWDRFATIDSVGGRALEGLDLRDAVSDGAGGFWVATATDLYRLDRGSRALYKVTDHQALGMQWIHSLQARGNGTLWIGHSAGLALFDPVTKRTKAWPFDDAPDLGGAVEAVAEAADGTVWIDVTGRGTRAFTKAGRPLPGSQSFESGWAQPKSLQLDTSGIPWRAEGSNLLRWSGLGFITLALAPGAKVDAFAFAPGGRIWVARFGILEAYDWNGRALVLRQRMDADDGLPAVAASGLLISPGGQVWASTVRGLVLYSPQQGRLHLFGVQDGIHDPDFSLAKPTWGAHGSALALSTGGPVLFDAEMRVPDMSPRPLVIESLSVMRGEDAVDLDPAQQIQLQPQDRDLRVTARLLSFADPLAHHYRFRLGGYDPDWVVQHADGERVFPRLEPGRYRLTVQAAGADGAWSKAWTIAISVLPPWWRTAQAIAAFAILAVLLLWRLAQEYRRRLKRRHAWQLAMHTRDVAEQASQAKTRFLATLGHEVRTPMTGVLGMSELLLGTDLDPRQRGHVESIRRAGDHLLRLVNDALDLARIEAGKLELVIEPFDLRALIDEIVVLMAPMAERKGLQFTDAIAADAPRRLLGDCGRVRQILLNLIGNAIKFTELGEVSLRVEPLQPHGVRFEIVDTGPGLNDEQRTRLFQRYEQAQGARTAARYGGSGLGLAISQELAAAMDGCIHVDSTVGKGTRFRVELPLAGAEGDACSAPMPGEKIEHSVDALQLLLVEDDPTVADVIAGLLRARGHHVTHAAHGLAALIEVAGSKFDVALLDLDLPGMNGLALAQQLRSQGFDAPLIAVTARADADAEQQSHVAGFEGFVRKPVTGVMLSAAIEAVLSTTADRKTNAACK